MTLNATPLFGVLFIVFFALFVYGTEERILRHGGRVVGGRPAEHEHFPFIVSIQKRSQKGAPWSHTCGGSIVNPKWVLTACHCVAFIEHDPLEYKDARKYRIVAGVTNFHDDAPERQEICVRKFFAHPRCNRGGPFKPYIYYDTGLIELRSPLTYSIQVQPLKFFSRQPNMAVRELRRLQQENAHCLSPGWGRIEQIPKVKRSPHLKVGSQNLHTAEDCHEILCHGKNMTDFPAGECSNLNRIEQLCVTSKDASICKGDSGGPLVCNGYVFGVVSQVGSSCQLGSMQIFSGIESVLKMVSKYIPDTENGEQ